MRSFRQQERYEGTGNPDPTHQDRLSYYQRQKRMEEIREQYYFLAAVRVPWQCKAQLDFGARQLPHRASRFRDSTSAAGSDAISVTRRGRHLNPS
jgi:hypothetical protein